MLSWSYKVGFLGTIFVWEKWLPQSHRGRHKRHPCAQSARRQRPCCRLLRRWVFLPKWICLLRRSLWSRVRALPSLSGTRILPAPEADLPKDMDASRPWIWGKTASSEFIFQSVSPRTVRLRRTSWFHLLIHSPRSYVQTASKSCGWLKSKSR